MLINSQTKLAGIIKESAEALDAIISISPKFEKLRNPILRKLMATRTSIATASKVAGCQVSDFFNKLKPLGFEIDNCTLPANGENQNMPSFLLAIQKDQLTELDVRPLLSSGEDPLGPIIKKIKWLKPGQVLKIINSFYPEPLILLLKKQGFDSFADQIDEYRVDTYFYRTQDVGGSSQQPEVGSQKQEEAGWDDILKKYKSNLLELDVRRMEMPKPMIAILDALDKLPDDTALFVHHKRIPVYLVPELNDRKFSYRVQEIGEGEVNLLIYKA
jgi:uncharacterized protein (DUF2249 family)